LWVRHHADDLIETLLLSQFFTGEIKSMPPILRADDGLNVVIRPLAFCAEGDIARYARVREFPIIPCDLCGSQQNLQRAQIKAMLADWEAHNPGRMESLFRSLCQVTPSHLADPNLFDFKSLSPADSSLTRD